MKKFIVKILLIGGTIFILIAICEYIVRQGTPNQYKYKHSYIMENGDNIKTLILGNSHTYYGVKPNLISESAFSLANVSQPLLYDYYILENYISYLPNLQHVILDVGYVSLRSSHYITAKACNICYRIYMNFSQISSFTSNFMCTEMALFNSTLRAVITQKSLSCDEFGWDKTHAIAEKRDDWDDPTAALERHAASENDPDLDNLSHVLEFCKKNNIELTIISVPIWHTYRKKMNQTQINDVYSTLKRLNERYEFNFYDFFNDERFVADDFFDTDHLSNIGAEKFSRILADTLAL